MAAAEKTENMNTNSALAAVFVVAAAVAAAAAIGTVTVTAVEGAVVEAGHLITANLKCFVAKKV